MNRIKSPAVVAVSLLLSAWAGRVEAVPVPIANHSFESPVATPPDNYIDILPDNWLGAEAVLEDGVLYTWVEISEAIGFTGGDGPQHSGIGEAGYIYQDLGVTFKPNMTYRMDLATAHRAGFNHSLLEFGLFTSDAIGTDVGTPGFADIQGIWTGQDPPNPDGDDQFNQLRDASVLQTIGTGALGHVYEFNSGATPPSGNLVAFIRHEGTGDRVTFDNIRLEELPTVAPGQAGDFDGDLDVDDADLNEWRTRFGADLDGNDFLIWQRNLGAMPAVAAASAVPEPAAWMLALAAGLAIIGRGRR